MNDGRKLSIYQAGWTLVELIIVMVLIGIITVITLPRFFDTQTFSSRGYYDEVLSAVRYARQLSVASGCDIKVAVNNSGYSLKQRAASGCDTGLFTEFVRDPSIQDKMGSGSPDFAGMTPDGVNVMGSISFHYDKLGRPRNSAGNLISGVQTVTIAGRALNVEPETGYSHP